MTRRAPLNELEKIRRRQEGPTRAAAEKRAREDAVVSQALGIVKRNAPKPKE